MKRLILIDLCRNWWVHYQFVTIVMGFFLKTKELLTLGISTRLQRLDRILASFQSVSSVTLSKWFRL